MLMEVAQGLVLPQLLKETLPVMFMTQPVAADMLSENLSPPYIQIKPLAMEILICRVMQIYLKIIPFVTPMLHILAENEKYMGIFIKAPMKVKPVAKANIARQARQSVIAE